MFRGLKQEMLVFVLGLTALAIITTTVISIVSIQNTGTHAASVTSDAMSSQAEKYLSQIAAMAAQQQDALFERMRNDTDTVAVYVSHVYEHPSVFANTSYWQFDRRVWRERGRYLNRASDVSSIEIPSSVVLDEKEKRKIELTANLDFLVPSMLQHYPDTVAIYAIDAQGVTRYYPNIVLGNLAPPDYDPRGDIYYKPATPSEDPERRIVWSPVYDDVVGRGLMITVTAPVYVGDTFEGIVATDILLKDIIAAIMQYSPVEGSYAFLIDGKGYAVAMPDAAYRDFLKRPRNEKETRVNLASSTPAFLPVLARMRDGQQGFASVDTGERKLFIAYAPLKQTGFSLGIVAEQSALLAAVQTLHADISHSIRDTIARRIVPTGAMLLLIASAISIFLVTRIVKPVEALTAGVREIGKGNLDYDLKVESNNEIGQLASAFRQMSSDLKKSRAELYAYSKGLEQKVAERTKEITHMNKQQENLLRFISHEVKGYLTKAQGTFAGIAEGDYRDESSLRHTAAAALAEMRRGVSVVRDILDASNMQRGTLAYTKVSFDFKEAVQKIVDELKPIAERKHLSLTVTSEPGAFMLVGDEEKMQHHVIRNLIANAITYSFEGVIRIVLEHTEDGLRFSVQDDGIGISPEDMPHLFMAAGRGSDSLRINPDSTGYGLFVARQVVEAHGGHIRAESEGRGRGSRFVVDIPTYAKPIR